jgi:hypothetical protein
MPELSRAQSVVPIVEQGVSTEHGRTLREEIVRLVPDPLVFLFPSTIVSIPSESSKNVTGQSTANSSLWLNPQSTLLG